MEAYVGGGLSFWIKGEFVILSFRYEDEDGGEWEAGEKWMTAAGNHTESKRKKGAP